MINLNGHIIRSGIIDQYYIVKDKKVIFILIKGHEYTINFDDENKFMIACNELEKDINREI